MSTTPTPTVPDSVLRLAERLATGELSRVQFTYPMFAAGPDDLTTVAAQRPLQDLLESLGLGGQVGTANKAGELIIAPELLGALMVYTHVAAGRDFRQGLADAAMKGEQEEIVDNVHRSLFSRPWKWYLVPSLLRRPCRSRVAASLVMLLACWTSVVAAGLMLRELERSLLWPAVPEHLDTLAHQLTHGVDQRDEQCTVAFLLVASVYLIRSVARWRREPVEAVLEMVVFAAVTVWVCLIIALAHPTPFPPPQGLLILFVVVVAAMRFTWRTTLGLLAAFALGLLAAFVHSVVLS